MKKLLLLSLLLITGCVNKFDTVGYGKMADAASYMTPDICALNNKDIEAAVIKFRTQLDWLYYYEHGFVNNHLTVNMIDGLRNEATRFNTLVLTSKISNTYCLEKVDSMRHTLSLIIDTEGRKY
jgi:hypothetical protein